MFFNNEIPNLMQLLSLRPSARARMRGNEFYNRINGDIWFYELNNGVVVLSNISGLPTSSDPCKQPIFALHIHEGGSCTGNLQDNFANARTHYNPNNCSHPYHAGDLPPLFGANGRALSAVLTDRVSISEIIGKTIIIHSSPDNFTTQPAGNSGTKIACGVITEL